MPLSFFSECGLLYLFDPPLPNIFLFFQAVDSNEIVKQTEDCKDPKAKEEEDEDEDQDGDEVQDEGQITGTKKPHAPEEVAFSIRFCRFIFFIFI